MANPSFSLVLRLKRHDGDDYQLSVVRGYTGGGYPVMPQVLTMHDEGDRLVLTGEYCFISEERERCYDDVWVQKEGDHAGEICIRVEEPVAQLKGWRGGWPGVSVKKEACTGQSGHTLRAVACAR